MSKKECMNHWDGKCVGTVGHRYPLTDTGKSFPRCDFHWDVALDREEILRDRYPTHAPSDFDPSYAGEVWDEADY